jgi:hypothetical protein
LKVLRCSLMLRNRREANGLNSVRPSAQTISETLNEFNVSSLSSEPCRVQFDSSASGFQVTKQHALRVNSEVPQRPRLPKRCLMRSLRSVLQQASKSCLFFRARLVVLLCSNCLFDFIFSHCRTIACGNDLLKTSCDVHFLPFCSVTTCGQGHQTSQANNPYTDPKPGTVYDPVVLARQPGVAVERSLVAAARVVSSNKTAETCSNSGDLRELFQHTSPNSNRMTPSKARVFLASVESAKSAPARPSAQVLRRPAAHEGVAPEGVTLELSDESDACDVSCEHGLQHAEESTTSHSERPQDGGSAAATTASDLDAASDYRPPVIANGVAACRSKAAVPLHRYMRVSDSSSRDDVTSKLVYSSHLQLEGAGHNLVDSASNSDAQVKLLVLHS